MTDTKRSTTSRKAPQRQAKMSLRNSEAVLRKLRAEKKSVFPKGFVETIERDLTGSGKYAVSRRIAFAYLDRPWPVVAKTARDDREFAVATAHIADVLDASIRAYELLLGWIQAAQLRMLAAVATREDADRIMAEGRKDSEYAASPAGQKEFADFLATFKRGEVPRGYVTFKPLDGPLDADHG